MLFDMFTKVGVLWQGKQYFGSSLLGSQTLCEKEILSFFSLQLERTDVVHFFLAAGDFTAVGLMDGNKKEHGMLHCFTNKSCIG